MKIFFAAAGWQTLVTLLVFVAISVISSWLNRRRGNGPPARHPGQRPPQPMSPAANWEEQLRRLLEGEEPAPPRPPPPIVAAESPRPLPPPLPPVRRQPAPIRPVLEPGDQDIGLPVPLPSLTEAARAYQRGRQLDENVEDRMRRRATMAESTTAYQQAQKLDDKVAEHLKHLTERVTSFTSAQKARPAAPEIVQAKAMLHDRSSVRAAIIASVILGPPKAMES